MAPSRGVREGSLRVVGANERCGGQGSEGAGLGGALSRDLLAPELRELVAEGVVRRGEALVFAMHAGKVDGAPGNFPNLTLWECSVSSFHLDYVVPVAVGRSDDGEPVIGEADQVLMLRHGLGFALEVVRLVSALEDPVPVCCIVGANSTNGTSVSIAPGQARHG